MIHGRQGERVSFLLKPSNSFFKTFFFFVKSVKSCVHLTDLNHDIYCIKIAYVLYRVVQRKVYDRTCSLNKTINWIFFVTSFFSTYMLYRQFFFNKHFFHATEKVRCISKKIPIFIIRINGSNKNFKIF